MALIDYIDDRDTTYIIEPENSAQIVKTVQNKFKEWQTAIKNVLPVGSVVNHLGSGRYKIDLPIITCIGSEIVDIINIPYMHQLLKVETKHTDSAAADSEDGLDYSLSHRHHPNLWIKLLDVESSVSSDIIDEYIDYFMSRGEYQLSTNTTNTDLLHISIYIRITGE